MLKFVVFLSDYLSLADENELEQLGERIGKEFEWHIDDRCDDDMTCTRKCSRRRFKIEYPF